MWRCERQKQSMVAPAWRHCLGAVEIRLGSTSTKWLGIEEDKPLPVYQRGWY